MAPAGISFRMRVAPLLEKYESFAAWLQSPLLLVLRLYWGWSFAQTGWGKLTHLDRTADFFASLHIPAPKMNAMLAGCTECTGGILLLLGLYARVAAAPLTIIMLVAYATDDREALFSIVSDTDKFTGATPFLFLLACLVVLAFGPGGLSLDGLFRKRPTTNGQE